MKNKRGVKCLIGIITDLSGIKFPFSLTPKFSLLRCRRNHGCHRVYVLLKNIERLLISVEHILKNLSSGFRGGNINISCGSHGLTIHGSIRTKCLAIKTFIPIFVVLVDEAIKRPIGRFRSVV